MKRIKGCVKHYEWGSRSKTCAAAKIGSKGGHDEEASNTTAEVWFGTHPSGASSIMDGDDGQTDLGCSLPYLLKVISVAKPLSLQVHPNKTLAKALHRQRADLYPDKNHKPEVAFALTEFELLCGIKDPDAIKKLVKKDYPGLYYLFRGTSRSRQKYMANILAVGQDQVMDIIRHILGRENGSYTVTDKLILKLYSEHGCDSGVLSPIFMNHIVLNKGDSVAIFPMTPHTYLSGDAVECMASSDNVIRLGLTCKPKDTELLRHVMLRNEYRVTKMESVIDISNIKEFVLEVIDCEGGYSTLTDIPQGSILLVLEGTGYLNHHFVCEGMALYFEKPETQILFSNVGVKVVIAKKR
jgi:mannose-6-phosphate isomerase